ncbi:MAG: hypothetical protein F6J90_39535 [Moorea sp. SIOASIH]|nr:hypothetical protein [Moorena sp. SIOASIH]
MSSPRLKTKDLKQILVNRKCKFTENKGGSSRQPGDKQVSCSDRHIAASTLG